MKCYFFAKSDYMGRVNSDTSINVLLVNSTSSLLLYMICKFQLIFSSIFVLCCYVFSSVFKL
jgi:hypothetical protein